MASEKRITGRHVMVMLGVFFGVIFISNAVFITYAVRSFPGESEKKSYMQGLQYNDVLAERATQRALGWRAEVTDIKQTDATAVVQLRFFDKNDHPLSGLTVEGVIKRPTHQGDDKSIAFMSSGNGVYAAPIKDVAAGVWALSVIAQNEAGEQFSVDARIEL